MAIALKQMIIPCLSESTALPLSRAATEGIFQIGRSPGMAFVYSPRVLAYPSALQLYWRKPNQ
jgi:hypothetical protein